MHAFFTAEPHRWRWTHEVLPILEALQNADVILTYHGRQCAVVQTRFGEGAYQVFLSFFICEDSNGALIIGAVQQGPMTKMLKQDFEGAAVCFFGT